jgi:hypothetical protein
VEKMNNTQIIGWREWVALPSLGIPAIKAKVDTGARTSALHTFFIEEYAINGDQYVKFDIHPVQNRTDIILQCEAEIHDKRNVRDSGGHEEERYVIKTDMMIGHIQQSIEVTLTSRDDMKFRMLLGRSALIKNQLYVDPDQSYLLGDRVRKHSTLFKEN